VAAAYGVESIRLDENSTRTDYLLSFLDRVYCGMSDVGRATDEVTVTVIRGNENPVASDT